MRRKYKAFATALMAAGVLAAHAAAAQGMRCAPREQIIARLAADYTEQLTGAGLQADRNAAAIVEVWASEETGTFTVLLTNPQGMSCIVAAGTDWALENPAARLRGTRS